MTIRTPLLSAALAWPFLWASWGDPGAEGGFGPVAATLVVIALPAHTFVVGFGPAPEGTGRSLDTGLLRAAAWF